MKHGFKKLISAVLSAVLLAVSLVVPLSAEEATGPVNLITDGGFENQTVGVLTKVGSTDYNKWGILNSGVANIAEIVSGDAALSGEKCAKVSPQFYNNSSTKYLRSLGTAIQVSANTDYILTFWAKSSFTETEVFGAVVPADGGSVYANLNNNKGCRTPISGDSWTQYILNFNSGALTAVGLMFGGNTGDVKSDADSSLYIDNIAVFEKEAVKTVSVEASGNNTATASSTLGLPGTVLTATAQAGSAFVGWYVNGQQVSAESKYTLPAALTENTTFLAKFTGNLIKDGDFESLPAGSLDARYDANGNPKLKNFCWGRVATGVSNGKVVQAEGAGHTGNGYLEYALASRQFVRTVGTLVPVEQNKQYQLTFWAKSNAADYAISAMILKTNATNGNSDQQIATNARIAIEQNQSEWQQYSLSFNSGSYTQVAVAFGGNGNGSAGTYAIDDVVLSQVVTVEAQAKTLGAAGKVVGGTVTGGGTYDEGQQVTLTAKANSGFTFAGWSNGAQTETVTVSAADQTLVASFKNNSKNLIVNGDLEAEDFEVADVFETVGQKALFQKVQSPTGTGHALKAEANKATGLAVNNIAVLAGHSYAFSCKLYLEKAATHTNGNNFERIGFWKNSVAQFNTANFPFEKSAYKAFTNITTDKVAAVTGEWVEYSFILTPEEDATLAVGIGSVDATCNVDWYIDDIALYDLTESAVSTGVDSSTGTLNENGFSAAIRAADSTEGNVAKNGLRLYNAVEKGLLSSVKEYGTIVVRKAYLEKANKAGWTGTDLAGKGTFGEPVVEMHGIGGIGFGVAYRKAGATTQTGNKEVAPILWRDDFKDSDMYTAYATGIQEQFYSDAYLFRTYAILENNAVVYGDTVEVSVFDVANAISNAENAPANDVAAFNAFVNENTKAAYRTWCETNQKATGKLFK